MSVAGSTIEASKERKIMAYVSEYGNWGQEQVLVFDDSLLTEEQFEILDEVSDYSKMSYVKAIINADDLAYWEEGR
jgi:hypothetical protein